MTTLVSLTAATGAAGASRSAASTSPYAPNMPMPAAIDQREKPRSTTPGPRTRESPLA
jgi:hypothetical protein